MKEVTMYAVLDEAKCTGCRNCERICPVLAIKVKDRKACVDLEMCMGCGNCEQRCPSYALTMAKREKSFTVGVDITDDIELQVNTLCRKARLHPEQIVCYCTATRAGEVAAAILGGARSPEEVSRATGVRTGCKVECIQPVLRLLDAAGIAPVPPKGGYQWYGKTPTVWDISEEVKAKYSKRGFHFDDDIKLLEKVISAPLTKGVTK